MRHHLRNAALVAMTIASPGVAYAGCAGHHAILGAAAGCAIGHHRAVEKRRAEQAQAAQPPAAPANATPR
jgi:hypothetical protein